MKEIKVVKVICDSCGIEVKDEKYETEPYCDDEVHNCYACCLEFEKKRLSEKEKEFNDRIKVIEKQRDEELEDIIKKIKRIKRETND